MVKYACFTFATLVVLTLTDFTAAENVKTVRQVNIEKPGLISATVNTNLPAKSILITQNLWGFATPYLSETQDLTQVLSQLTTIHSFLNECEIALESDTSYDPTPSSILGQIRWNNLKPYLRNITSFGYIIGPDSLTVDQTVNQISWIQDFFIKAASTLFNSMMAESVLTRNLWGFLSPHLSHGQSLTPRQAHRQLTRIRSFLMECFGTLEANIPDVTVPAKEFFEQQTWDQLSTYLTGIKSGGEIFDKDSLNVAMVRVQLLGLVHRVRAADATLRMSENGTPMDLLSNVNLWSLVNDD